MIKSIFDVSIFELNRILKRYIEAVKTENETLL